MRKIWSAAGYICWYGEGREIHGKWGWNRPDPPPKPRWVELVHPSPPIGDGAEYDKEDAERAWRERLGVKPSSRFLNIGVDNQVTWPRTETLIEFDRYTFVLMPKTKDHVQSIHVDLNGQADLTDRSRSPDRLRATVQPHICAFGRVRRLIDQYHITAAHRA